MEKVLMSASKRKGVSKERGLQGVIFPPNLFNTWLAYRKANGQSRADVIREVNATLDRKYGNEHFYKWKKQKLTVPELVVLKFINPELPQVLKWFFKTKGYPTAGMNFQDLADAVQPAIKDWDAQ